MKQSWIGRLVLAGTVLCLSCTGSASAQVSSPPETPQPEVVLTKLAPVVVPPLALQANIVGDVIIEVHVRKDGSIESAELVNGHPMLVMAALRSAKQSEFECPECKEPVNTYLLTYSFEIKDDGDCCNAHGRVPAITQNRAHVTIVSAKFCICDPGSL